jgi:chemotaxis protein methyltransferase CheR
MGTTASKIEHWNFVPLFNSLLKKYKLDLSRYASASLDRRLERFLSLHEFESMEALTDRLLNDSVFFDHFVKEITVNTTEMFRDPACWQALRTSVLPALNELPTIRIWHAGCSSGEEVYSMAILLKEEGLYEKSRLVATDLNKEVIATAAAGHYSLKSIPLNAENYLKAGGKMNLSDYYTENGHHVIMHPSLLENVKFLKHDLSTGTAFSKFDLILCRNVIIYFNKDLQESVFSLFLQSLFKRGILVIGKKEVLNYFSGYRAFSEFDPAEKIYRLM